MKKYKIFEIVGALIFISLGAYKTIQFMERPRETATITNRWTEQYRSASDNNTNTYRTRTCYSLRYQVNGRFYQNNICQSIDVYGAQAEIVYRPDNPQQSELFDTRTIYLRFLLWGLAPLIVWIVIVQAGVYPYLEAKKRKQKAMIRERQLEAERKAERERQKQIVGRYRVVWNQPIGLDALTGEDGLLDQLPEKFSSINDLSISATKTKIFIPLLRPSTDSPACQSSIEESIRKAGLPPPTSITFKGTAQPNER